MSERVTIYTDGACSGNPGPGGWGALLLFGGRERELSGGEALTTNNRMELTAAIMALEGLTRPCTVDLFTDSQYVRDGITKWLQNWQTRGWRTADKKPVKNEDLWRRLDAARQRHQVVWHWVRGHADNPLNHRVDALAVAAMTPFKKKRRVIASPLEGEAESRRRRDRVRGQRDISGKVGAATPTRSRLRPTRPPIEEEGATTL